MIPDPARDRERLQERDTTFSEGPVMSATSGIARLLVAVPALAMAGALLSGCDSGGPLEPSRLAAVTGEEQYGPLNAALPEALRVEVLSAPGRGWLGGVKPGQPVAGARVVFRLVGNSRGARLDPDRKSVV